MYLRSEISKLPLLPFFVCVLGALVIVIAVMTFEFWSLPQEEDKTVYSSPKPLSTVIGNFCRVHPYFFRGSVPSVYGMPYLKSIGVKTIVDLRGEDIPWLYMEEKSANLFGMKYVRIPMILIPTPENSQKFMQIMRDASNGVGGPVFVHCSLGADRTGFMTAMWRVQHDHWRPTLALAEMLKFGFFYHRFMPAENQLSEAPVAITTRAE